MKDSPLVAEVRRIRHQIAKECGYDPDRITQHAMEAARRLEAWKRTRATASLISVWRVCAPPGDDESRFDL